jgi:hypothetical protein
MVVRNKGERESEQFLKSSDSLCGVKLRIDECDHTICMATESGQLVF